MSYILPKDTFSILISTKDRIDELKVTLENLRQYINDPTIHFVIYDDGSTDGTSEFVKNEYPEISLHRNEHSRGYLFCRNEMLNAAETEFAISLDDDAHIVTENFIQILSDYFKKNRICAVIALRLFWGYQIPNDISTVDRPRRVQGFVGCGHVWRLSAWRSIPNYPEWFEFYGEEDFAAFHLALIGLQVHYVPQVLVQHRVDVANRKKSARDYTKRLQRSLRSGWYLNFMFYPKQIIWRRFFFSIWSQVSRKVIRGDFNALLALVSALFDILKNRHNISKGRNNLPYEKFLEFQALEPTKIFWKPSNN